MTKNNIYQFIKFGLVGCSNTVISLAIYYVLVYFKINYIIANIVGFIVSVLNAYYWNSKYVFKSNNNNKKSKIIKTYCSYGLTFLLSNGLLYFQVDILGISKIIAPIVSLLVTIPTNFLLNKFWTFK